MKSKQSWIKDIPIANCKTYTSAPFIGSDADKNLVFNHDSESKIELTMPFYWPWW